LDFLTLTIAETEPAAL
jgi:hypothetical protein